MTLSSIGKILTMQLRDYQQKLHDDIITSWNQGYRNVLAVLPTGGGKTVSFSHIVKEQLGAAIVLAHRAELVEQMSLALAREGVRHRVIGPPSLTRRCRNAHIQELHHSYCDPNAKTGVASVQSVVAYDDKAQWFNQVQLWVHDEAHHLTTLKSGLDAFIKESKDKAQEPGQILYEGLNSALDKTSDNLAKLFTGQKTKWKDEFKSIGEQMLQSQIKSSLQKAIGISGTPKGTANDPIYTKSAGGVPGVSSGSGGGGLFGGGSQGGGIFSLLKKVPFLSGLFSNGGAASAGSMAGGSEMDELASLTAMADGGDVSPGNLYKVNDRKDGQPEVFKPSQSGSIIPIDQLGTSGVSYHIDARGAALGVENRIFAGIKASHNQAVSNSVKANRQKQIRTPQRSGR